MLNSLKKKIQIEIRQPISYGRGIYNSVEQLSFQITIQRLLGWSGFLHQSQGFFKQNVKTSDFDTSRPDELFDNEDKQTNSALCHKIFFKNKNSYTTLKFELHIYAKKYIAAPLIIRTTIDNYQRKEYDTLRH